MNREMMEVYIALVGAQVSLLEYANENVDKMSTAKPELLASLRKAMIAAKKLS